VTLGFGSLALVGRDHAVPLPTPGDYLLVGSALALLVAAVLALVTNVPLLYRAPILRPGWSACASIGRTRQPMPVPASRRPRSSCLALSAMPTTSRAIFLIAAVSAEVTGVSLLASTVAVVVLGTR
jgi:hypothetical protein